MTLIVTSSIGIGLLSESRSFKIIRLLLLESVYFKVNSSLVGVFLIVHHLELWSLVVFCILLMLFSLVLHLFHFLALQSWRHAFCVNIILFVGEISVTALFFIFRRLFIVFYLKMGFQAQFFLNFFFLIIAIFVMRNVTSLDAVSQYIILEVTMRFLLLESVFFLLRSR